MVLIRSVFRGFGIPEPIDDNKHCDTLLLKNWRRVSRKVSYNTVCLTHNQSDSQHGLPPQRPYVDKDSKLFVTGPSQCHTHTSNRQCVRRPHQQVTRQLRQDSYTPQGTSGYFTQKRFPLPQVCWWKMEYFSNFWSTFVFVWNQNITKLTSRYCRVLVGNLVFLYPGGRRADTGGWN